MSLVREARDLVDIARAWHNDGQPVALLTLVKVRGSAYRRPGAKMVMAANGRMKGTLSGGCLEGDLFVHAERVMETKTPVLVHYDLTEDEMWGLGIGCKGQVDIWIEPLDLTNPFWAAYAEALAAERPIVWGGRLPEGSRYFAAEGGPWRVKGGNPPPFSWDDAAGRGPTGEVNDFWWDVMRPPERLLLAGAGHDARPVAKLAQQAGFDVVVLDPREHVNNEQYFPDADHWVKAASEVSADAVQGSYWVIMDHHQRRDEEALKLAVSSRPQYLGVLGPRSRTQEMIAKLGLAVEGIPLRSPVGLDLGAESPDEVAVSIVSELMAARSHTSGGSLDGKDRIHP